MRAAAVLAALLLPFAAHAGKPKTLDASALPGWVREAIARPSVETGADLVWLHEERTIAPQPAGGVLETCRYAARILKVSALEAVGTWTVTYRKEDEVRSLQGWTLLPSGGVRIPHPKDDVEDSPWVESASVYVDSRRRSIHAAGATVGSVVAFEWTILRHFDPGAATQVFGSTDRPTLWSRFVLVTPEGWGRDLVRFRAEGLAVEETPAAITVTGRALVPPPREESGPPDEEILPVVWGRWFSPDGSRGFRDWDAVGRWYQALTAPVLVDRGEAEQIAERLKPSAADGLVGAIGKAYDFAARAVRYVSVQIGIGGFRPHAPAEVCRNRYGDCKDKAFLLKSIVEPWGLATYPVLVRTRDLGKVVESAPTPSQFNHCILAIALPDDRGSDLWPVIQVEGIGRLLLLDATADRSSPWNLPAMDQGAFGLVAHAKGGALVRLPPQPPRVATAARSVRASLDAGGALHAGRLVDSWTGNRAASVRGYYFGKSDVEHRTDVERGLHELFPGAVVSDYGIEGLDAPDAAVVETTGFDGGRCARRAAGMLIVEPGRPAVPLLRASLPPPPRTWPLSLGTPREDTFESVLEIPAGWRIEEVPRGATISTPEIDFRSEWTGEGNRIVYRRTSRLKVLEVPPERYAAFREALLTVGAEDARGVALLSGVR